MEPMYVELVCLNEESILIPREISSLPDSFYLQMKNATDSEYSMRRFVRDDSRRVYVEQP